MAEQVIKQIRTQFLHVASWHHRTHWGNMTALRDSIADHGIIEPIVVRDRKGGGYEVVCGVRRMKAAVMADAKTMPCIVRELDDVDAIAMQVAENLEREGLHPMDEAMYFADLTEKGMDHAAIAKRFLTKKRDVVRRLKLMSLGAPARKAFIDGKFDEEAAMALARLSDAAKQKDVLAAIDAGSLQPEEIAGYVQREFTASLDDVPWRKTDDKLVVKAGACTTCHKRSDVQKDLFAGDQVGLRCLDVDCYRSKMDASWDIVRQRDGAQIHDADAHSLFIPAAAGARPVVVRSSGMLDADGDCKWVPGLTWREAVAKATQPGAEAPTEYIARDQDGRPRYLLRESIVLKMVRRSEAAKTAAALVAAKDPGADSADDQPPTTVGTSARQETKIRRAIIEQFALLVVDGGNDTWEWVTDQIIEGATPRAVAAAVSVLENAIRGLDTPELDGKAALLELARTSNRQARHVATAIMIFEAADGVGEIPEAINVLAGLCTVDLGQLEREVRKAP